MIRTSQPIHFIDDLLKKFRLGYITLDEAWERLDEFLETECKPKPKTSEFRVTNRISTYLDSERID